jgi:rubrerythrin
MYPEWARIAREENNEDAALWFERLAEAERRNLNRFTDALGKLDE